MELTVKSDYFKEYFKNNELKDPSRLFLPEPFKRGEQYVMLYKIWKNDLQKYSKDILETNWMMQAINLGLISARLEKGFPLSAKVYDLLYGDGKMQFNQTSPNYSTYGIVANTCIGIVATVDEIEELQYRDDILVWNVERLKPSLPPFVPTMILQYYKEHNISNFAYLIQECSIIVNSIASRNGLCSNNHKYVDESPDEDSYTSMFKYSRDCIAGMSVETSADYNIHINPNENLYRITITPAKQLLDRLVDKNISLIDAITSLRINEVCEMNTDTKDISQDITEAILNRIRMPILTGRELLDALDILVSNEDFNWRQLN